MRTKKKKKVYHYVGMAVEKSKDKADSEIKPMSVSIIQAL